MEKLKKLNGYITNALIEYNANNGSTAMTHALGDIELTNEVLTIMVCFNDRWDRANSEDGQELDNILDYYTGEIINWLKANNLYEHALNHTAYSHS